MTDLQQFDMLWEQAQHAVTVPHKVGLLKRAVELYKGPVFENACTEHWILSTVNHYQLRYMGLVNELLATLDMKDNWKYYRGDIYLVDLGKNVGSEQGGCRPVLVLQNNVGNRYAPTLIVAPISSRFWKKADQPTHCILDGIQKLNCPSVLLAEQIITVDKSRVAKYLGRVPLEQMDGVDRAVSVSLGLEPTMK